MSFKNKPINTWDEILEFSKDKRDKWVFRGQKDASYGLATSFERACDRWQIDFAKRPHMEKRLRREFRRKLHHYTDHVPEENAYIEWLSVMQHYGTPTRLLDFTYSIYVATYFAIETTNRSAAIWAINAEWAVQQTAKNCPGQGRLFIDLIDPQKEEHFGQILFSKPPEKFVCPLNPFRLNERITLQKGLFMCPGDITKTFEENLMSLDNYEDNVLKLVVPFDLREKAIKELFDMNVSRCTLFPGLDGFAASLGVFPPPYLVEE